MVRSLVLVLLLVGLVAGVGALTRVVPPRTEVDWQSVRDRARTQAAFRVLAPEQIPQGWTATSATFVRSGDASTLRLAFVTAEETFMGLAQTDLDAAGFVARSTRGFNEAGSVRQGGRTWRQWTEVGGEDLLLVNADNAVAVVITSTAEPASALDFARSLT